MGARIEAAGSKGNSQEVSKLWIETELRRRFLAEAFVTNPEKGYVSVPFVNQRVDLPLQGYAADLIVNHFRQLGITFDAVVGIPNSGIPLATSVAERIGAPLAPGRKGKEAPGAWKTPIIVDEKVPSFTTEVPSSYVFNGIEEGEHVLIVDDVNATGTTIDLITKAMKERKITVDVATYFAKLFQGGDAKLRNNGLEPFNAIEIVSLTQENGVWIPNLAPAHFR